MYYANKHSSFHEFNASPPFFDKRFVCFPGEGVKRYIKIHFITWPCDPFSSNLTCLIYFLALTVPFQILLIMFGLDVFSNTANSSSSLEPVVARSNWFSPQPESLLKFPGLFLIHCFSLQQGLFLFSVYIWRWSVCVNST